MQIEVRKPTEEERREMEHSPTWTSEVKEFPWHYDDKETCLIVEGEVTIKAAEQEVSFGPGDYVIFPQGLDCTWNVKKPVLKHYKFGE
jgi:uncharacterized protein